MRITWLSLLHLFLFSLTYANEPCTGRWGDWEGWSACPSNPSSDLLNFQRRIRVCQATPSDCYVEDAYDCQGSYSEVKTCPNRTTTVTSTSTTLAPTTSTSTTTSTTLTSTTRTSTTSSSTRSTTTPTTSTVTTESPSTTSDVETTESSPETTESSESVATSLETTATDAETTDSSSTTLLNSSTESSESSPAISSSTEDTTPSVTSQDTTSNTEDVSSVESTPIITTAISSSEDGSIESTTSSLVSTRSIDDSTFTSETPTPTETDSTVESDSTSAAVTTFQSTEETSSTLPADCDSCEQLQVYKFGEDLDAVTVLNRYTLNGCKYVNLLCRPITTSDTRSVSTVYNGDLSEKGMLRDTFICSNGQWKSVDSDATASSVSCVYDAPITDDPLITTTSSSGLSTTTRTPGIDPNNPCMNCTYLIVTPPSPRVEGSTFMEHFVDQCHTVEIYCTARTDGQEAELIFENTGSSIFGVGINRTFTCNADSEWVDTTTNEIVGSISCAIRDSSETDDTTISSTELTTEQGTSEGSTTESGTTGETTETSEVSTDGTDITTDESTQGSTDSSTDGSTETSSAGTDETGGTTETSTTETGETDETSEISSSSSTDSSTINTEGTSDSSTFDTTETSTDETGETSDVSSEGTTDSSSTETGTGGTTDSSTGGTSDSSSEATTDSSTIETTETSTDDTEGTTDLSTSDTEGTTDSSTEGTTDSSTEGTTDSNTGGTSDSSTEGTTESSTDGTTDSSTGGTSDSSSEGTTDSSTTETAETSSDGTEGTTDLSTSETGETTGSSTEETTESSTDSSTSETGETTDPSTIETTTIISTTASALTSTVTRSSEQGNATSPSSTTPATGLCNNCSNFAALPLQRTDFYNGMLVLDHYTSAESVCRVIDIVCRPSNSEDETTLLFDQNLREVKQKGEIQLQLICDSDGRWMYENGIVRTASCLAQSLSSSVTPNASVPTVPTTAAIPTTTTSVIVNPGERACEKCSRLTVDGINDDDTYFNGFTTLVSYTSGDCNAVHLTCEGNTDSDDIVFVMTRTELMRGTGKMQMNLTCNDMALWANEQGIIVPNIACGILRVFTTTLTTTTLRTTLPTTTIMSSTMSQSMCSQCTNLEGEAPPSLGPGEDIGTLILDHYFHPTTNCRVVIIRCRGASTYDNLTLYFNGNEVMSSSYHVSGSLTCSSTGVFSRLGVELKTAACKIRRLAGGQTTVEPSPTLSPITTTTAPGTIACSNCNRMFVIGAPVGYRSGLLTMDTVRQPDSCIQVILSCAAPVSGEPVVILNKDASPIVEAYDRINLTLTCNENSEWITDQQVPVPSLSCGQITTAATTASTTTASTVTQSNCDSAQWADWEEWSTCPTPCGSCGSIQRFRVCNKPDAECRCTGSAIEKVVCNTHVCLYPYPKEINQSCCSGFKPTSDKGEFHCLREQ